MDTLNNSSQTSTRTMYDFFKSMLKELKMLTGSRQYEEILSLQGDEKETREEKIFNVRHTLIESLVLICTNKFAYIPDAAKQKIISDAILQDPDFVKNGGLNAKFIYKTLIIHRDTFWQSEQYQETNKLIEKLQPKEISESTEKLIRETLSNLAQGIHRVPEAIKEMEEIKKEDKERQEGKQSLSKGIPSRTYRKEYLKMLLDQGLVKWAEWHRQKPETDLVYAFKIEDQHIVAKDEDEAREIFAYVRP